eukprot:CAMPEP_0174891792 /NCGR_PEP_ID=MMETSP0167-20121228/6821_1 /TAXON_ID=38298 /ORGANISM="Rhodella maculata, Strain CCMP736" /LENGTH=50 /DNA_ID=CAMNT_0016130079 /DNA_START=270 /DNA_END=419 /DNA_ORIENTATION=+
MPEFQASSGLFSGSASIESHPRCSSGIERRIPPRTANQTFSSLILTTTNH